MHSQIHIRKGQVEEREINRIHWLFIPVPWRQETRNMVLGQICGEYLGTNPGGL
jgi:hypothetical protein